MGVIDLTHHRLPLAERVRAVLAAEPSTREVPMFGGLSFMVNEKMVVSVLKDGNLLVRVDARRNEELVALPGAGQAEMGAGRTMGPGWISVDGEAIASEERLSFWIGVALAYNGRAGKGKR